MSQAKPEAIEIFCRVLSQELTRSMGVKIEIDPKSLSADLKKPANGSKVQKRAKSLIQNPEKKKL